MKRNTKIRRINKFKKYVERKFGIKFFNVEIKKFKKLSNEKLDEFFELLKTKLIDANSWGRRLESIYWSERDLAMVIAFCEHGDYLYQFKKYITFSTIFGEAKNFNEFVIKGIRKATAINLAHNR